MQLSSPRNRWKKKEINDTSYHVYKKDKQGILTLIIDKCETTRVGIINVLFNCQLQKDGRKSCGFMDFIISKKKPSAKNLNWILEIEFISNEFSLWISLDIRWQFDQVLIFMYDLFTQATWKGALRVGDPYFRAYLYSSRLPCAPRVELAPQELTRLGGEKIFNYQQFTQVGLLWRGSFLDCNAKEHKAKQQVWQLCEGVVLDWRDELTSPFDNMPVL